MAVQPWIDVSLAIRTGMLVWPGDEGVEIQQTQFLENGDLCNLTKCRLGAHTGTHMDAPRHFVRDGVAMDALPLDAVMGECRVVRIHDPQAVRPAELPPDLKHGERILFQTENSFHRISLPDFRADFVYVSQEAARVLADAGVRTVGIDYLSVAGFSNDTVETHVALLAAGIWVIEGLDLSRIEPGRYELACLPLNLVGSDGAPARAALRPI